MVSIIFAFKINDQAKAQASVRIDQEGSTNQRGHSSTAERYQKLQ